MINIIKTYGVKKMRNKLKVNITDKQSDMAIPTGIRLLIRKCCHAVLSSEEIMGDYEVNVDFVDNKQIRSLNKKYRNVDSDTDVLSFPSTDTIGKFETNQETGAEMLGDIAISIPKVYEQAEKYGHSLRREFAYLTVHSMLHLLGYDHEEDGIAALRMREKEETVLAMLGLQRDASYVDLNEV